MATTQDIKSEYYAALGDREFYVMVKTYAAGEGYNAGEMWVSVEEYILPEQGTGWNRLLMPSEHIVDARNDLEAIRKAFRQTRARMNTYARYWRNNTEMAAKEQGGKRGYYTKQANQDRKRLLGLAADWKLCKAIWKAITKL